MADIDLTLRREKLSHLTIDEVDANFVNLRQGIIDEENARNVAIAGAVADLNDAISDEESSRIAADNTLTQQIQSEVNARVQSYNTLDGKINTEIATRTNDYYTKTDSDARYVNVSGDTVTGGNINFGVSPDGIGNYGLYWSNNTDHAVIQFQSYGDDNYASGMGKSNLVIGLGDNGNEGFQISNLGPTWSTTFYVNPNVFTYKGHTIWHAGNDGAGSGLDADTLDGLQASAFASVNHGHNDLYYTKLEADSKFVADIVPVSGSWWNNGIVRVKTDGVSEIGRYLDFHYNSASGSDFDYRIECYPDPAYGSPCIRFIRGQYFSSPQAELLNIAYNIVTAPSMTLADYVGAGKEKLLATKEYVDEEFYYQRGSVICDSGFDGDTRDNPFSNSKNYAEIFPPSGFQFKNFVSGIVSLRKVYFSGDVNGDDRIGCEWMWMGNRIRILASATEQLYPAEVNYLFIWKRTQ